MKTGLPGLTATYFSPFDGLLTEHPLYIKTEGGSAGFTNAIRTISACGRTRLFKKTEALFPFSFDLQNSSRTIAEDRCHIHYVSSLNV